MTQASAITSIRARFVAQVATPQSLAVVYDNGPEPAITSPWARATVAIDSAQQLTMGATPRFRASGSLTVNLFVPRETGDEALTELSQMVVDAFQNVTTASPLVRYTPVAPFVGATEGDESWSRRTVRVPFLTEY